MGQDLASEFEMNVPLFEMIQSLRQELAASMTEARDRTLRFAVGSIDLEMDIGVKWSKDAHGKLTFWAVSAQAGAQQDRTVTAKFKIALTPVLGSTEASDKRVLVSKTVVGGPPNLNE